MDFLADRGVDNTFADELIELSTALEHQEYIKFLEDLNGFIKCPWWSDCVQSSVQLIGNTNIKTQYKHFLYFILYSEID